MNDSSAIFERERGRLTGLAYRMLGSLIDAEDAVQDAWLRWQAVDVASVDKPAGYLSSVVTRLCLDRLKEARRKREVYVGPWLPEPVLEDPAGLEETAFARDVSLALLLALERLSPLERAAFILHDVFELDHAEVAGAIGRSQVACRQLAARARQRIRAGAPRYSVDPHEGEAIASAFFAAARNGDVHALGQVLAEGVELHSDGGGRKPAALRVIFGAGRVARFYAGVARKHAAPIVWSRAARVNNLPGMLTEDAEGTRQATSVEIVDGRVARIYAMRNPDKLCRLWQRFEATG